MQEHEEMQEWGVKARAWEVGEQGTVAHVILNS